MSNISAPAAMQILTGNQQPMAGYEINLFLKTFLLMATVFSGQYYFLDLIDSNVLGEITSVFLFCFFINHSPIPFLLHRSNVK